MKGGNNILSSDLLSQVPLTNHQGPQSCSDLYEQVVFPAKSTLQNPHYILKQQIASKDMLSPKISYFKNYFKSS